jgi:hypothetical protein
VATVKKESPAKPTPVAEWKQQAQGKPLEVPSGKTALVRNPGMEVFLRRGLIPNSLMPIVRKAMSGKEPELNLEDITEDQLQDMVSLFDAITVYCVVEPKVLPVPADNEERREDVLYVDEVDFEDKQFIFQWVVGGTRDVEKFRAEQKVSLESLRGGAAMESKAK